MSTTGEGQDGDVRQSAKQRHDTILALLAADRRVEAADLCARLGVAVETVRRDLRLLEDRGSLVRAHGGAVPVDTLERPARPMADAASVSLGAAAAQFFPESGAVLVGDGPHCLALAEAVLERRHRWSGLQVATTSVDVAVLLSRRDDLIVHNLGGQVGPMLGQQGEWTLDQLERITVDVAFCAPTGVDVDGGLTMTDTRAGTVASAVVASARSLVAIAEAAAVGRVSFWRFGDVQDVDVLVADVRAPEHELAALGDLDLKLERVETAAG